MSPQELQHIQQQHSLPYVFLQGQAANMQAQMFLQNQVLEIQFYSGFVLIQNLIKTLIF